MKKGNYETAISQLRTLVSLQPTPRGLAWLGWAYASAGRKDEAHAILTKLKRLSPQEYCPPTSIAAVYGALGEKDEAFAWLDAALREHGGIELLAIKVNLPFDPLRSDPRFAEVLRRRGLAQ